MTDPSVRGVIDAAGMQLLSGSIALSVRVFLFCTLYFRTVYVIIKTAHALLTARSIRRNSHMNIFDFLNTTDDIMYCPVLIVILAAAGRNPVFRAADAGIDDKNLSFRKD